MKGVIIVNQSNEHTINKINRFFEEAINLDLILEVLTNDGTLAYIDKDGSIKCDIVCDFIIYLDKDIYLAKMLEKKGYKIYNNSHFLKTCDDKTLTYIALANNGIRMPLTISSPLIFQDELEEKNILFLDKVIEKLGLPLIAKKVYGSLGEGVYLIKSKEDLLSFYKEHFKVPLQFQEDISMSSGHSVRALVIDHKLFGAFERYNNDDFRSNYSNHSLAKPIVLADEYKAVINKIIDIMDIKYAGIDLLFGEDGPVLCEVNSNAFFEVFEKVTGLNAAKAYLEMIVKDIKNEQE